jgi:hypothetical protein
MDRNFQTPSDFNTTAPDSQNPGPKEGQLHLGLEHMEQKYVIKGGAKPLGRNTSSTRFTRNKCDVPLCQDTAGKLALSGPLSSLRLFLVDGSCCVHPEPVGEAVTANLRKIGGPHKVEYEQSQARALAGSLPAISCK